ncbi:MAG: hypothetical protein WA058_03075 [Minisyncoccia bacterium]
MPELVPLLVFCQALGAVTGACTAVWSEIAYVWAMRDKKIDSAERTHLNILARGLRYGMTLFLLSSLALVVEAYVLQLSPQPALSAGYWISITLALLVVGTSWALSRHLISFPLGSATVFTSWWFLAYLTLGQLPSLSFSTALAILVVVTAVFYAVLQYGRFLALRK